jgi:hypothetical protein
MYDSILVLFVDGPDVVRIRDIGAVPQTLVSPQDFGGSRNGDLCRFLSANPIDANGADQPVDHILLHPLGTIAFFEPAALWVRPDQSAVGRIAAP